MISLQLKVQFSQRKVEKFIRDLDYTKCVTIEYETDEKSFSYDKINDVYKLSLTASSSPIRALSPNDNIYVLIDNDLEVILYVGKSLSKDINSRLAEHLLKNETSDGKKSGTSSKIKDVYFHLKDRIDIGKNAKIRYYTFEVYPEKLNASVEGHLISYIKRVKKQATWNLRNG